MTFRTPLLISLLLIPLCSILFSQDYIWPTDASRLFSSSFAESRGSRFHAGIDIKTHGITGFPIRAIRDGHVSRISMSPYGYGRGLYFTLDTGETVVFGHLSRFNDDIQAYVKSEQKRRGSYDVQLFPKSSQFVFQQGDTLGYTGDSGVGYPHLHFELRDANSNPINPLSKGYTVVDNVAPHISKVLVQPLDALSTVDDDFLPRVFWTRSTGVRSYSIDRPIRVSGRIGIGVSAFDQMDGVSNKFGTHRNELYVDDKLVFAAQYDKFSYAVNNHFKLDRDYRQMAWGKGYFYNLFVDFGNKLSFYENRAAYSGVVDFDNTPLLQVDARPQDIVDIPTSVLALDGQAHTFEIVLRDYWGNTSRVNGRLFVDGVDVAFHSDENSLLDSIYKKSRFAPASTAEPESLDAPFEVRTKFFDRYVRIVVASQQPLQGKPLVSGLLCSGQRYIMPLIRKSAHSFVGAWPLSACDIGPLPLTIYGLAQGGDSLKQTAWIEFTTVSRGRVKSLFSADSLCRVDFATNSLFKDLFVRIDTLGTVLRGYDAVGRLYKIQPTDVPLNKGVSLTLTYPETDSLPGKLGVYIKYGSRMRFVGARLNSVKHTISTSVKNLGSFSLVRDVVPPVIMALSPTNLSHTSNAMPRMRAVFKDALSGIGGEKQRVLKLDGEKVIAVYDPEKLTLIYQPDEPLAPGEHTLELSVSDKSGNSAVRSNTFFID